MTPLTQTRETQAELTPEQALDRLRQGNERFRRDTRAARDLLGQVRETSAGQWPCAAILGCIDSRVPPELIFDQGIGDLFSVRVAGNIVNEDILGSLEFACKAAGAKLVVVLGHSRCGAVGGACDDVRLGNLTALLEKLEPALSATPEPREPGRRTSANPDFVEAVARENVQLAVEGILARSPVLAELKRAGEIDVVGALYDIETAAVEFLPTR